MTNIPPVLPERPNSPWPKAVMWICIAAIFAGTTMYIFHSCVEAPGRAAGAAFDRATQAARDLASSLITGTVKTQFYEYCTEVRPNLCLQVATLKQVEEFSRSDEALIANIPLPEVIVSVSAPVEYTYTLDLKQDWTFTQKDGRLIVRAPDLHVNSPAFDVSKMKWEVQKNSLIRNTTKVKEDLRQSLMPLAQSRGRAHLRTVRETARAQVKEFVEKWVRERYRDGKNFKVEVYFGDEKEPSN